MSRVNRNIMYLFSVSKPLPPGNSFPRGQILNVLKMKCKSPREKENKAFWWLHKAQKGLVHPGSHFIYNELTGCLLQTHPYPGEQHQGGKPGQRNLPISAVAILNSNHTGDSQHYQVPWLQQRWCLEQHLLQLSLKAICRQSLLLAETCREGAGRRRTSFVGK